MSREIQTDVFPSTSFVPVCHYSTWVWVSEILEAGFLQFAGQRIDAYWTKVQYTGPTVSVYPELVEMIVNDFVAVLDTLRFGYGPSSSWPACPRGSCSCGLPDPGALRPWGRAAGRITT